ncbi:hypothetical protein BIW11_02647 [Tropilaelaps mercedesae]|uniref:Uncharacterized protein n=1 Tax=Tropilaelaps mercedesae TaxID=418985 RepID=A0A1V9XZK9_9ACAR|nr:hypothetical protein BIW11_02647 [Tropilaelaps mercedesae]
MESDEGLSQAIFSGSQDERPEIGYGGGDFVQKLLAKAQFRDESTGLCSPTPVKPAGRVGLRRNRRTSKEKELALLGLRMPPQASNAQRQHQETSPGPITRSRSSLVSSSGTAGARSSPCPSLDDSTEILFGAIPPTPPLASNGRTINPSRSSDKDSSATCRQSGPQNSAASFEKSSQGPVDLSSKQPITPTNRNISAFASGIHTSKSSTPVSTPTLPCRTKPARLLQKSPSCSQATTASPESATGNHRRQRGSAGETLLGTATSNGQTSVSQAGAGRFGQRIATLRRDTVLEAARKAADTNGKADSENGGGVDSSDEDELLSQAASLVEKKFIALQTNESHNNTHYIHQTVTKGRPKTSSNAAVDRNTPEKTTSNPGGGRTPRKKRSKEREPSLGEPLSKQNGHTGTYALHLGKSGDDNQTTVARDISASRTVSSNGKYNQSSTSLGEARRMYTDDEIRRKREAALRKRQQKLKA